MRKSIQATNVVLNLAVVPNVILMPSNFIILSDKIEGYNNILTTATNEMLFGVNKDDNYTKHRNSKPKVKYSEHKSDGLIDDYKHNNSSSGSSDTSNDSNSIHDNIRGDNKRFKTARSAGNPQLPIMFFVSLAAGIIVSKKIFTK